MSNDKKCYWIKKCINTKFIVLCMITSFVHDSQTLSSVHSSHCKDVKLFILYIPQKIPLEHRKETWKLCYKSTLIKWDTLYEANYISIIVITLVYVLYSFAYILLTHSHLCGCVLLHPLHIHKKWRDYDLLFRACALTILP